MKARDDKMAALSIRDAGPYSVRNSSKGALLGEAALLLGALSRGVPKAELRSLALSGQLLTQRSYSNRERIFDTLSHRYLSYASQWMLDGFTTACAYPTATAASTAFPPILRMSTPTFDAKCCEVTTMPFLASTAGSDAASALGRPI